jgi:hypothetical protein
MRSAAAVVLILLSAAAQAHPGHGESAVHPHGFSPEMILLVLLFALYLVSRSR